MAKKVDGWMTQGRGAYRRKPPTAKRARGAR